MVVAQRPDERGGVGGHGGDRVRHLAARGADPAIVEGDDVTLLGDRVDHAGIPVVQDRREVVQKHERGSPAWAELPVGERDAPDVEGVGRGVFPRRDRCAHGSVLLGQSSALEEAAVGVELPRRGPVSELRAGLIPGQAGSWFSLRICLSKMVVGA